MKVETVTHTRTQSYDESTLILDPDETEVLAEILRGRMGRPPVEGAKVCVQRIDICGHYKTRDATFGQYTASFNVEMTEKKEPAPRGRSEP